jgi:hypothetical protein
MRLDRGEIKILSQFAFSRGRDGRRRCRSGHPESLLGCKQVQVATARAPIKRRTLVIQNKASNFRLKYML